MHAKHSWGGEGFVAGEGKGAAAAARLADGSNKNSDQQRGEGAGGKIAGSISSKRGGFMMDRITQAGCAGISQHMDVSAHQHEDACTGRCLVPGCAPGWVWARLHCGGQPV